MSNSKKIRIHEKIRVSMYSFDSSNENQSCSFPIRFLATRAKEVGCRRRGCILGGGKHIGR